MYYKHEEKWVHLQWRNTELTLEMDQAFPDVYKQFSSKWNIFSTLQLKIRLQPEPDRKDLVLFSYHENTWKSQPVFQGKFLAFVEKKAYQHELKVLTDSIEHTPEYAEIPKLSE